MTDTHPRSLCPKSILVGVDYSPESKCAAKHALRLARQFGARVHFLHAWVAPYAPPLASAALAAGDVIEPASPDLLTLVRRSAEEQMAEFAAALDGAGVDITTSVESGDPGKVLPDYAVRHACDWVIVGKRSLSQVSEWLLGNVAAYVVRHCQAPVLVVPNDEAP